MAWLLFLLAAFFAGSAWGGQVVLTWTPPTTNEDGSCIEGDGCSNDLLLYKMFMSETSPVTLESEIVGTIYHPIITFTHTSLSPGTYYYAVNAVDLAQNESELSNEVPAVVTGVPPIAQFVRLVSSIPDAPLITLPDGALEQIAVFTPGASVYSDRDYTFGDSYPSALHNAEYIVTRNDQKNSTVGVEFTLSRQALVNVLYDSRVTTLPEWLDDGTWFFTGDRVGTTDGYRDVHEKIFPAGDVLLGGNAAPPMVGANSMYSVVLVEN